MLGRIEIQSCINLIFAMSHDHIIQTPEVALSVQRFWFGEGLDDAATAQRQSALWWSKNDAIDREIKSRFEPLVLAASRRELDAWAATPGGLLSLILLTDQFPRNMYRGLVNAFSFDSIAREWCRRGLAEQADQALRPIERVFLYLPLEHSESIEDQQESVRLFRALLAVAPSVQTDLFEGFLKFALRHRGVIERFGRFPHRNAILARVSTAEELAFLEQPGSSF